MLTLDLGFIMKHLRRLLCMAFACLLCTSYINIPVFAEVIWPEAPSIKGEAAIVIDADTGAVLYEKNPDKVLYPASITKVVTAIVAIENAALSDTVTFSNNSINSLPWDAARLGMVPGEEVNLLDCLYGLILRSGNEVANALAEHVSGTNEDFAVLMTEYAKNAGATNTNFANPSGLHDDNHYTTARDFAKIVQCAVRNDIFCTVWGEDAYKMPATNKNSQAYSIWHRHNMLVSTRDAYYEKAVGGKTGFTNPAGNTLVTYAKDGDLSLISVVLKSNTDNVYKDTKKILDYGFANFEKVTVTDSTYGTLLNSNSFFSNHYGIFSTNGNILHIENSDIIIAKNTSLTDYDRTVTYADEIKDGVIATIDFSYNGLSLGSVPVKLAESSTPSTPIGPSAPTEEEVPDDSKERTVIEIKYIIFILVAIILLIILLIIIRKIIIKRRRRRYNYEMSHRRLRKRYKYRRR